MITLKANYPWGERDIHYDSWIYKEVYYTYDEKIKEWIPQNTEKYSAINDLEYDALWFKFKMNKITPIGKLVEYNSNCYERQTKTTKTLISMMGFLKIDG